MIGVDEVGRGSLAGPVVAGAAALRIPLPSGVDLTGQESHAGPVVTGAAAFKLPKSLKLPNESILGDVLHIGINDSKKLTPKKRESMDGAIKKHFHWAVGEAGVGFINSYGIRVATEKAMRAAVVHLLYKVLEYYGEAVTSKTALSTTSIRSMNPHLIIDAFHVKYIPIIGVSRQLGIIKGDEKCISIAAASVVAKVYRDNLMKQLHTKYPHYSWNANSGYGTRLHIEMLKKHGWCRYHRNKFIDGIIGKQ